MDDVINASGAEDVDWNFKVECCGGAFSVSRTASVVRLGRAIIEDARAHGAEAIVVACPLCHSNLDLRQKAMTERGEQPLPILFVTQVVGLALGLPAAELGLDRHFVDTEPFIRGLVGRAPRVRDRAEGQGSGRSRGRGQSRRRRATPTARRRGDSSAKEGDA